MIDRQMGILGLVLLVMLSLASLPAQALEAGLLGVPIYATPKDLIFIYGTPAGIVVSGPGGLAMNSLLEETQRIRVEEGMMAQPTPKSPPAWASQILPANLASNQQVWIYRLQGDVVAGFVIRGLGDNAVITDIIACLLYTSPSPRDRTRSRMPSSA